MSAVLDNVAVFPVPAQEEPQEAQRKKDNDGLHKRRGIWHFKMRVAGRWKEKSTRTSNYQEARKERTRILQEQEDGRLPTDIASWTFARAADRWLEGRKKIVAPSTWRLDKIRLERLRESLAEKRLVQITASDVSSYQLKRLEKVEPATINSETKVLRLILKSAKVWSRIADDFSSLRESRKGPGRALLSEQEKKLFEIAMGDEKSSAVYHAAILAANTSARGCELRRLKLKDVDLVNSTLTIRRESTKTDAGCRVIPLNTSATQAVEHLLRRATLLKCVESDHFLFPGFTFRHTKDEKSHKGAGYDPTKHQVSWRTSWRNLTKKAGLTGLRFHDLRHHCITKLAEAGVADQTLMAIAGHVSKAMLDHYSHVRLEARRAAVATLDTKKTPPMAHSEANVAPTPSIEAFQ